MRFLKVKRNGRSVVEPLEKGYLFRHCTGGHSCIEFDTFLKETVPILNAHGIQIITYDKEK
jgi:hypothetical protein